VPLVPTWVVVCVRETEGKVKKLTPSELTATVASSRKSAVPLLLVENPFSKTAKSAPDPLVIGWAKVRVIEPPSPRLTTCAAALESL
jgi:hypothetical protein